LNWLQEIPDPMTSAVWNTWAEINLQTAERMGIRTGDIVRIRTDYGYIDAPAVPTPGLHPQAVAMPIGNGHAPGTYGRNPRGSNPLAILAPSADTATGALAYSGQAVTLQKIADAISGWNGEGLETLVLAQDRPGGQEPEAVMGLIHTTAKEWKAAQPVHAPSKAGSIFHRET
jgi:hypothetical protein